MGEACRTYMEEEESWKHFERESQYKDATWVSLVSHQAVS